MRRTMGAKRRLKPTISRGAPFRPAISSIRGKLVAREAEGLFDEDVLSGGERKAIVSRAWLSWRVAMAMVSMPASLITAVASWWHC